MDSATPHITRLHFLSQILAEHQIPVAYLPPNEDTGEMLLVTAAVMNGKVVPLRLIPLNDIIPQAKEGMAPLTAWLLHASLIFPFHIPDDRVTEVMRATQLVSRILPLCSLGVMEPDGACYLQACVAIEDVDAIPRAVLMDVIGMARMAASTYGPALADIAAGTLSYAGFAKALEASGLMPPSLFSAPVTTA
ncbi:hypothetical protein [Prosthecobacter sp.]|uniref:hypothetical protein n=1 Tax=Prosthecobacter sp. TaxID=1965333 RepID=UPI0037836B73